MAGSVYLAGEIHSDRRDQIADGAQKAGLDVTFSSPVTDAGFAAALAKPKTPDASSPIVKGGRFPPAVASA